MPVRPCLTCGRLSTGNRCRTHTRTHQVQQQRHKRTIRPYTRQQQERRAQAVQAWIATHGHWCPGYHRPPHPATDLTADHVHAVAAGGSEHGPLQALCRPCNSAKRDRP